MDGQVPISLNGAPEVQAQITITMTSDGKVHLQGPIQNKVLCYGLLEIAKETIGHHKPDSSPILTPRLNLG